MCVREQKRERERESQPRGVRVCVVHMCCVVCGLGQWVVCVCWANSVFYFFIFFKPDFNFRNVAIRIHLKHLNYKQIKLLINLLESLFNPKTG